MSANNIDNRIPRMPDKVNKDPELRVYFETITRALHDAIEEIKSQSDRLDILET